MTGTAHLTPRNDELLAALRQLPPIPDLQGEVLAALGVDDLTAFAMVPVLGFHVALGVDLAAVYLVTDRVVALFEANAAGRSYTLTVALTRLRRVGRLEDAEYTRLVLELEADRATSWATVTADGRSEGQIIPAGYELVESDPAGRASLRRFQRSLSAALAL